MSTNAQASHIWIGVGIDVGGHGFIAGSNTMVGNFYNLDDYGTNFAAMSERVRLGPGLGGSIGSTLFIVSGVSNPAQMQGFTTSGYDFNFAIGAKWGKLFKMAMSMKRLEKVVKVLSRMAKSKITRLGLKQATKLSPDDYADLVKRVRELIEAEGMTFDPAKPAVLGIGIPLGAGLEVSGFHQTGRWSLI